MALKKAELSDGVIVRMVEMDGRPAENVHITLAAPIVAAREKLMARSSRLGPR